MDVPIRKVYEGYQRSCAKLSRLEGCIAEENVVEETIEFFSDYQRSMKMIGIPPDH